MFKDVNYLNILISILYYIIFFLIFIYSFSILIDYLEIIHTLKNKIKETDDLLEVKKQAKSEFAYSLSKNMMKAISNLSMEVMSLN